MEKCIIFCAGDFDFPASVISSGDYLIAADGGLIHLNKLNLTPHVIIGDFDSLGHIPKGALVFPVEKDDTDSMLAIRHGLAQGYRQFLLYGALDGPRLDHTIANLQALQYLADHDAQGFLIGLNQIATVIKDGKLRFPADAKGIVSVFCMGANAEGVSITGCKYTLKNGTLSAGFPLGVSNHFTGEHAEISVQSGSLLVIFQRGNFLPEVMPC